MLRGRWSMNADFRMSSRIFHGGAHMEALLGDGPSERRILVCALSGNEDRIILWRDGRRADAVCKSGTDAQGYYLRSVGGCAWILLQGPKASSGGDKSPDLWNWRRNMLMTGGGECLHLERVEGIATDKSLPGSPY